MIQPGAIHASKNLEITQKIMSNHRRNLHAYKSRANKRVWHIVSAIMKVEAAGCFVTCGQ